MRLQVLLDVAEGGKSKEPTLVGGSFHPDLVQEFNPNIVLDNLKQEEIVTPGRRLSSNSPPHLNSPAHSIQLAAKMVCILAFIFF